MEITISVGKRIGRIFLTSTDGPIDALFSRLQQLARPSCKFLWIQPRGDCHTAQLMHPKRGQGRGSGMPHLPRLEHHVYIPSGRFDSEKSSIRFSDHFIGIPVVR